MKARHLPSLEALVTDDDERMSAELDLLDAAEQMAEARRMLEQVERIVTAGALGAEEAGASSQALARLGYKLLTTATALRRRMASSGVEPSPARRRRSHRRDPELKPSLVDSCGKPRLAP